VKAYVLTFAESLRYIIPSTIAEAIQKLDLSLRAAVVPYSFFRVSITLFADFSWGYGVIITLSSNSD